MVFDKSPEELYSSISSNLLWKTSSGIHSEEREIMFTLPYLDKKERRKTVKFPLSWACEESLKESLEPSTLYAPSTVSSLLHRSSEIRWSGKDRRIRSWRMGVRSRSTIDRNDIITAKFGSVGIVIDAFTRRRTPRYYYCDSLYPIRVSRVLKDIVDITRVT